LVVGKIRPQTSFRAKPKSVQVLEQNVRKITEEFTKRTWVMFCVEAVDEQNPAEN